MIKISGKQILFFLLTWILFFVCGMIALTVPKKWNKQIAMILLGVVFTLALIFAYYIGGVEVETYSCSGILRSHSTTADRKKTNNP
jgi:hypothetical protein